MPPPPHHHKYATGIARSRGIGPFRDRSKSIEAHNFSPMRDIRSVGQDAVYNNVLLCVSNYGVSQCEILAYRLRSDTAVTAFHDAFAALSAKTNNRCVYICKALAHSAVESVIHFGRGSRSPKMFVFGAKFVTL